MHTDEIEYFRAQNANHATRAAFGAIIGGTSVASVAPLACMLVLELLHHDTDVVGFRSAGIEASQGLVLHVTDCCERRHYRWREHHRRFGGPLCQRLWALSLSRVSERSQIAMLMSARVFSRVFSSFRHCRRGSGWQRGAHRVLLVAGRRERCHCRRREHHRRLGRLLLELWSVCRFVRAGRFDCVVEHEVARERKCVGHGSE